jgi:hypothetical protein
VKIGRYFTLCSKICWRNCFNEEEQFRVKTRPRSSFKEGRTQKPLKKLAQRIGFKVFAFRFREGGKGFK